MALSISSPLCHKKHSFSLHDPGRVAAACDEYRMKRRLQRNNVTPNCGKGVCRHGACGALQARDAFLPATKYPTAGAHAEAKQRYTRDAKRVRAEGGLHCRVGFDGSDWWVRFRGAKAAAECVGPSFGSIGRKRIKHAVQTPSFIHVELSESLEFIFTVSELTDSGSSTLGGGNSVCFRNLRSCIARRLVMPHMHTTSVTGELMRTVDSRNSGV